ncbi:hypothetical protein [Kitasatospora sp. NPDC094011]|uniref:hypothetical protein n=1 Tax=Kitasatospora sp. NPDC094011 TaxID=3364090 RepID=UPI0038268F12
MSDAPFLSALITRQLEELLLTRAPGPVSVHMCELADRMITGSGSAEAVADLEAIRRSIAGAKLAAYPYKNPAAVEKAHNGPEHPAYAKRVWQAIAGPGHGGVLNDSMELLAQHIDLELLSQLPSYQRWLADTEDALKTKGFL